MRTARPRAAEIEDDVCRRDDCLVEALHAAHVGPIHRRRVVEGAPPKVVRVDHTPDDPLAYVRCPRCDGAGCKTCSYRGQVSLLRWHYLRGRP